MLLLVWIWLWCTPTRRLSRREARPPVRLWAARPARSIVVQLGVCRKRMPPGRRRLCAPRTSCAGCSTWAITHHIVTTSWIGMSDMVDRSPRWRSTSWFCLASTMAPGVMSLPAGMKPCLRAVSRNAPSPAPMSKIRLPWVVPRSRVSSVSASRHESALVPSRLRSTQAAIPAASRCSSDCSPRSGITSSRRTPHARQRTTTCPPLRDGV